MAFNRRLIFWLIKAYIKKWRKTILLCFLLGLIIFFFLNFFLSSIVAKFPLIQKETIGVVGAYTTDSLPQYILRDASRGLTKLDPSGKPQPDLAKSWEIKNDGKTYVFHLKPNEKFTDGSPLTSSDITFTFSDVKIERPDALTIVYDLKDPFAPFLVTIAKPIFKDNYVGLGDYRIKDIKLNGNFVVSLTLVNVSQPFKVRVYQFYPTQEAVSIAFVLGNISKATGLNTLTFKNTSLDAFPNASVTKEINNHQLVTLFYNTQDKDLNNSRLRDALSYAIPNTFSQGEKAYGPYADTFWAYQPATLRTQDMDHAKLLIQAAGIDSNSMPSLTISTLPRYENTANAIATLWKSLGIKTKVKVVDGRPDDFQIFLGNFNVPQDPDQYTLWHSNQENNITKFANQRIDKLLEDGRKTINVTDRLKIYADFQKYLEDEQPATFLYFPYMYTITRK